METPNPKMRRWRLTEDQCRDLSKRSFPIDLASISVFHYNRRRNRDENALSLGNLFCVLECNYGPTSTNYDDFKQSFSFPFLLQVDIGARSSNFVFVVTDYRGSIEFQFRRMKDESEYAEKDIRLAAVKYEEMSDLDAEYVVGYHLGFFEGFAQSYLNARPPERNFYRAVRSNLILYGYMDETFFERSYDDSDAFDAELTRLELLMPTPKRLPKDPILLVEETRRMLNEIKSAGSGE